MSVRTAILVYRAGLAGRLDRIGENVEFGRNCLLAYNLWNIRFIQLVLTHMELPMTENSHVIDLLTASKIVAMKQGDEFLVYLIDIALSHASNTLNSGKSDQKGLLHVTNTER